MRAVPCRCLCAVTVISLTLSCGGGEPGGDPDSGRDARADAPSDASADHHDTATVHVEAAAVGPGNDHCTTATTIPLSAATPHQDLIATTVGATHDVDAPCVTDMGADVFYEFSFAKRVIVYADTFGASWNTVLFLLSNDCTPLSTPTTSGDALCNDDACATEQSQIVAVLDPGSYRLGLSGRGADQGAATIHFEWALAGSGTLSPLPQGSTVQPGTTVGTSGEIEGLSPNCLAAGPENSYWWTNCPSDPGGMLNSSTCGGTSWETVLEAQIPASAPYTCNLDACGLQSTLTVPIPASAGLRVLSVDGQGGTDNGAYTLTVTRP